jgi:hypothetical protein
MVEDLSIDRVALGGGDPWRALRPVSAVVSCGRASRAAAQTEPHAFLPANDDERLFIVRSRGFKELDDQVVVHDSGGIEVLNSTTLLLCVSQRKGTAFFENFDVVADVADRNTEDFCDLIWAPSLTSLLQNAEYAAALRSA